MVEAAVHELADYVVGKDPFLYASGGVRVNAIAPGYVATRKVIDYWNGFPDPAAAKAETLKLHPGGRIATPEEIALAAVFMISDECPFMNAACLTIDGGLSVQQHPAWM